MSLTLALIALADAPASHAAPMRAPTARDLAFLQDFTRCVVDRNAKGAGTAIDADFRETVYRSEMDKLVQSERGCLLGGTLRMRGVVLAGFFAEALIRKQVKGVDPVAAVAYDPSKPVLAARDEAEVIALCTARAQPTDTVALLATAPGTPEESAAIGKLVPQVQSCTAQGVNARFNKPGLRAILALAFRRLATQSSQNQGGA